MCMSGGETFHLFMGMKAEYARLDMTRHTGMRRNEQIPDISKLEDSSAKFEHVEEILNT